MGEKSHKRKWANHSRDPIMLQPDGMNGFSHKWGDASITVKSRVIGKVISMAKQQGLDDRDTAYLLSLINAESGFNPSAATAAAESSATGLGQFTDTTRHDKMYDFADKDMWDVRAQIGALIKKYKYDKRWVANHGDPEDPADIYRYYHDGYDEVNRGGKAYADDVLVPGLPAWEEVVRRWDSGAEVAGIRKYALPGGSGKLGYTIDVYDTTAGPGGAYTVNSDNGKLTLSRAGITTVKNIETGITTASIPGLGEGLRVDSAGMVHAGGLGIRIPLKASDNMGGVYGANFRKLVDIPYGSSIATNGMGVIVLDGKSQNAPGRMVLPDGSVAQFAYDSDGKPSGISISGQGGSPRYTVALQKTQDSGFSIVTKDNQTHTATSDIYGQDNHLVSSKTENAAGTLHSYRYDKASNITSQTDFNGERTTIRTYKLMGPNVNALSQMEVDNPDGSQQLINVPQRWPHEASHRRARPAHPAAHGPESGGGSSPRNSQAQHVTPNGWLGNELPGSLSFNADGSGSTMCMNPDGTKTTVPFNSTAGAIKLADFFGTLPKVAAAYPDKFALRYTGMANQQTAQPQDQLDVAGGLAAKVGAAAANSNPLADAGAQTSDAAASSDGSAGQSPDTGGGASDSSDTASNQAGTLTQENQDAGIQPQDNAAAEEAMA